jgi:hypothetical protein
MHIRRGFLGWGVFLILAGAVPLAVRSGYLSEDQVGRLWTLWPLILVGIGVGLILSRTRFDFLGGIIVAATFGLMVGGLLSSGIGTFSTGACGATGGTAAFPSRDGTFAASSGAIDVQTDCGTVTIAAAPGNAWRVEGQDADGVGPAIEASETTLRVRSREDHANPFWAFGQRDTWRITIPGAVTTDIDLQLNAGQASVDLSGAIVGGFGLQLNAGSGTVDLSSAEAIQRIDIELNAGSVGVTLPHTSMVGTIHANAGAVRLCAQPGVALRLQTGESIVASYDYAGHGLVQDGSTWTTPGFDSAAQKIELTTEANAGSFALDPEDGCD